MNYPWSLCLRALLLVLLATPAWATDRTDTFTRGDSASSLGTPSDGGSDWVALSGTWGITNNTGYTLGTLPAVAVLESSTPNVLLSMTLTGTLGSATGSLVARAADANNYLMLVVTSTSIAIWKQVAGVQTNLGTTTITYASGDTFKFLITSDNTLWGFQNATVRIAATDSAGSANTLHGIRAGIGATPRFDNFTIASAASYGAAPCAGANPTWTALSAGQVDVQACVSVAVTGSVVNIPSGTSAWGATRVNIPSGKQLTLQGAGIDVTTLSCTVVDCFIVNPGGSRLTGFTLTGPAATSSIRIDGDGWRVDHIKLISATPGNDTDLLVKGLRYGVCCGPTGLIDHMTFVDSRPYIYGIPDTSESTGSLYSSALGLGDANAVYVEDSVWIRNAAVPNGIDCGYSGRYVFRFNTVISTSIDAHGAQGWRGCRRWEVYGNQINFQYSYFAPIFLRGGTGMIFGNSVQSGFTNPYIEMDVPRVFDTAFVLCNGLAARDGNQIPNGQAGQGWPCRDQIGWNTDISTWTATSGPPAQTNIPAYIWSNTIAGSAAQILIANGTGAYFQANREYFLQGATFNGTSGVGVGTLAARPATCTTGVGYWATDQGSWNTSSSNPYGVQQSGADGVLYKCASADTWTLHYTPYTYPHPLNVDPIPTLPTAPANLRTIGSLGATDCTIVWDASGLPGLLGYHVYHGMTAGIYSDTKLWTDAMAVDASTPARQLTYILSKAGIHYFSVTAFNASGDSAYSTEISCVSSGVSRSAR